MMAYTTISQVSLVSSTPVANNFSLRRSLFTINNNPTSFLNKGSSNLCSNLKITTRHNNDRVYQRNVVVRSEAPSKHSVSPLVLEDALRPPTNLYTAEAGHVATFRSVEKLGVDNDGNETYHVVFEHGGFVPHWEGQVFGVLKPGANPYEPVSGQNPTLFSVASSRYGDSFDGQTASFCVGRGKPGSISDFLCTSKPGDKLQITGPTREAMIIGDYNNPKAVHIMIATGTGIAPFRGIVRRFFAEDIPNFQFSGLAWLFGGHSVAADQYYQEEFSKYVKDYPHNFRYNVALSKEMQNNKGEKLYVQDIVADNSEEIFDLLSKGAFIYFAGLKGMVQPIEDALAAVAAKRGLDWVMLFDSLKQNGQWRVEVY